MTRVVNLAQVGTNATTTGTLLTAGTAQNTTSGTSIDFTGIPSWAKRVTVMLYGVSTSGTAALRFQLGAGSITTSGYTSVGVYAGGTNAAGGAPYTTGFGIPAGNPTNFMYGHFILTLISSNTWVCSAVITSNTGGVYYTFNTGGVSPALSGALDRVRITTANGTDTFDAGSINILYE